VYLLPGPHASARDVVRWHERGSMNMAPHAACGTDVLFWHLHGPGGWVGSWALTQYPSSINLAGSYDKLVAIS